MSQKNKDNSESAQTVELLENTIAQLNGILTELRTNQEAQLPPLTTVQNLASTTAELAKLTGIKESTTEETVELTGLDRILPSFTTLDTWWGRILAKIRNTVPSSRKISDLGLTGIVTGIVVIVLLTSVIFLSQQPQPSQQVAEVTFPPQEVIKTPELTPEKTQEAKPIPREIKPEIPLESEKKPSQKVSPKPQLELTPEQSLIAAIQNQVGEITGQYAEGLILSIEANFLSSRLRVTVGDGWYGLTEKKREDLANEILARSQNLDFRKLELIDSENNLLARSPVVGNNMVILQH